MDGYPSNRAGWLWPPAADPDDRMAREPAASIHVLSAGRDLPVRPVKWTGVDAETLGAWVPAADGGRFRLLVEALPDGGWDWIVWRAGDLSHSGCGTAPTVIQAMLTAEEALARIAGESQLDVG